jgi:hypothetical protein
MQGVTTDKTDLELKGTTNQPSPCSLAGCHNSGTEYLICQFCNKNFCLQHRHQKDHNCSSLIPSSDDAQPKPLKAADVLKSSSSYWFHELWYKLLQCLLCYKGAHDSAAARGNTATKQAYKGLFTLIIIISAVCIV